MRNEQPNESKLSPTKNASPADVDLFGDPLPRLADLLGQSSGGNQDFGLTLNDDEWQQIEEVWEELTAENPPAKPASGKSP